MRPTLNAEPKENWIIFVLVDGSCFGTERDQNVAAPHILGGGNEKKERKNQVNKKKKANEKSFNAFLLLRQFGPRHNKNHVYRAFSSARQAYNETTTKWKAFYANNFFFIFF